MKIGYIYYTFYPVTGGASVHGLNLAKELHKRGHELFKINGDPDPYTVRINNSLTGLFWILRNCDLIYIRMDYFINLRNMVSILTLLTGKKIVVELNNPSDELHLFGRGKKYIQKVDRIFSKILQKVDAVITVSDPLKKYCKVALKLKNVHVIENGGEIFNEPLDNIDKTLREEMEWIQKSYSKIVVWSGSANNMQDLNTLEEIAKKHRDQAAVICIIKVDNEQAEGPLSSENLFVFRNLDRAEVKYLISNSDIGLALYRPYPWSRWGFYNSSLKIFEYLNNGLLTVTNMEGTQIQKSYPNFNVAETDEEISQWIDEYEKTSFNLKKRRTWSDVAEETSEILEQVVKN